MRVDVRVKFLLLIVANVLLLYRTEGWRPWSLVAMMGLVFMVQGRWRKGIIYMGVYAGMTLVDYYLLESLVGNWSSFGSMLFVGGRLMLPCFMAGSLILSTTAPQELISVFRKMRMPEGIILTFAVMLRFMPVVTFEWRKIQQSLVLRGVFPTWQSRWGHPVTYFEYGIVPLMMSASRIAQDLTIATLTKGVGIQARKSIYERFRFGWFDWMVVAYLALVLISIGVIR